ncbi:PorT family protein [Chitinophaga filiformis]|uniref:outer membrane beta-barrel protein n=1 Tax=Chitinophaga filiformis TaxID=104663 RepID=UPI001F3B0F62|nr:outer membrane beta-barrel protein [Chitinophaga filiformis]MCF6402841.1 PorT family protein [Chitinophaga filiformis]MCF6403241.1 PorT family protein [Chitinophaga filiformis]
MKKILLLALLAISMLPVYSQTSVGVIGGYNLASLHPKQKQMYGSWDYDFKQGWRAGLIADHRLWKKFHLQPQLLLNSKGYKSRYYYNGPFAFSSERILRMLYLELQANLLFKEPLGSGKLLIGAGPYLSRGIGGKLRARGFQVYSDGTTSYDQKFPIKFRKESGNDATVSYQKPYDAGLNFQTGYECKNGLFFNAVYSLGLTNYNYSKELKSKNTYFGLGVGYFLKKLS